MLPKMVRQHLSGSKGSARQTPISMAELCMPRLAGLCILNSHCTPWRTCHRLLRVLSSDILGLTNVTGGSL